MPVPQTKDIELVRRLNRARSLRGTPGFDMYVRSLELDVKKFSNSNRILATAIQGSIDGLCGRYDEMARHFKIAENAGPNDMVLRYYATTLGLIGDFVEAAEIYEKCAELVPGDLALQRERVAALHIAGKVQEAWDIYQHTVAPLETNQEDFPVDVASVAQYCREAKATDDQLVSIFEPIRSWIKRDRPIVYGISFGPVDETDAIFAYQISVRADTSELIALNKKFSSLIAKSLPEQLWGLAVVLFPPDEDDLRDAVA